MEIRNNYKIIKEAKLNVIIYNKIIIKEEISKKLMELYNNSNENNKIAILFKILSYIWIIDNVFFFSLIKKNKI